jgi:excisionase family DNA binding protein
MAEHAEKLPTALSYSLPTAMHVTGLGRSKLYELINDGTLARIKVGRRTLIRADSLRALVGAHD